MSFEETTISVWPLSSKVTHMWTLKFLDNENSCVILEVCVFLPSATTVRWMDINKYTFHEVFFLT